VLRKRKVRLGKIVELNLDICFAITNYQKKRVLGADCPIGRRSDLIATSLPVRFPFRNYQFQFWGKAYRRSLLIITVI